MKPYMMKLFSSVRVRDVALSVEQHDGRKVCAVCGRCANNEMMQQDGVTLCRNGSACTRRVENAKWR